MTPTPRAARRARHRRRPELGGTLLTLAGVAIPVETTWLLVTAGPLELLRPVAGGQAADRAGLMVGVQLLRACAHTARLDTPAGARVHMLRPRHARSAPPAACGRAPAATRPIPAGTSARGVRDR